MSAFIFLFIVMFVLGIVVNIYKFSATRDMAKRRGATENEATALALSGDLGTAAAYVKTDGPRATEDRIREVRSLEAKGLITAEQAEARVNEILKGV